MKRLTLFRHAKSGDNDSAIRDFDRTLNGKGRGAATMVGDWLAANLPVFDSLLISPSVRTRQTWEAAQLAFHSAPQAVFDDRIYLASSVTLLDVLRDVAEEAAHILLIGHNPGLEDLVFDLVPDDGSSPLRDVVYSKFPTAAVAELECSVDSWAALENGCARLIRYTRPRDLDPQFGPND